LALMSIIREMHSLEELRSLPKFIIVTGHSTSEVLRASGAHPPDGILSKPIEAATLSALLQKTL